MEKEFRCNSLPWVFMTLNTLRILTGLALAGIVLSCSSRKEEVLIFSDNFSGLRRGPLGGNAGAHTEYHYLPSAAPRGNWAISTFHYHLPESWYIRDLEGKRCLCQDGINPDRHWHPMVVAGDTLWRDYAVQASFRPESLEPRCGIAFRYRNDRCYYFFGTENGRIRLMAVHHASAFRIPDERILAERELDPGDSAEFDLKIALSGPTIEAWMNGNMLFTCKDPTYSGGRIALLADGPACFERVEVTMGRQAAGELELRQQERAREAALLKKEVPRMKLWKKVQTGDAGAARNLRFGDLDGDGTLDILIGQVVHHGPKDRNSELSCLTAMTFDGKVLWQVGRPDPWKTDLTNDVAFQIHDLDNDRHSEVIYCMGQRIYVAEGKTGRTRYSRPTPLSPGGKLLPSGHNIFPRILGDCIYFCDLEGRGYDGNLILKDRYRYVWTYDPELNLLWHNECVTGHYPYACDTDGDGKDELLMGYTLFDDTGNKLWSLDTILEDHADGVALVDLEGTGKPVYVCAASDEGMFFAGVDGTLFRHHYVGHVQNPAVANFRDDLPGLETVSVNFWGNQGIIHLYDAKGDIYHDFEPTQYGSMCLPLNWTGRSEEFFVLNANVEEGGAWDGYGRRVLEFPDDGHPDMCYAVLDLTGDCRDEIVVWDPAEIWVYTQEDNPLEGELYRPVRNPQYNSSNYQATVSLPAYLKE
jgi:rhamnogalacturonan endolyase